MESEDLELSEESEFRGMGEAGGLDFVNGERGEYWCSGNSRIAITPRISKSRGKKCCMDLRGGGWS